jgi:hypothetical protein
MRVSGLILVPGRKTQECALNGSLTWE